MRTAARCLALAALAVLALPALGQADPVVKVEFSNPGLTPSRWTITLHADGSGHFSSERGNAQAEGSQAMDAADVDRDIRVSPRFAARIFQVARRHNWFNTECESRMKVAFQGWKKASYEGPDGQGSCSFNYSRDKEIQELGDSLVAVAGTIQEGARLEMLLRHDRLGLDRELEFIVEAATDGRVRQICVIRAILERLAEDSEVMERVRKRAKALLGRAEE